MSPTKLTKEEKAIELERVKTILLATLDYHLQTDEKIITEDFNSDKHFEDLKMETLQKFQKGQLSTLKQWLRDFTEKPRETRDFEYVKYIKETTGIDFDIFEAFKNRIDKIIARRRITSAPQYYDAMEMINYLCLTQSEDTATATLLDELIHQFENKEK